MRRDVRLALIVASVLAVAALVALLAFERFATAPVFSAGGAAAAVADLRPAVVDGERSGPWLRVEPDGSLSATGAIGADEEVWRLAFERGSVLGLIVEQPVGRLRLFHVVPIVVDRLTELFDRGRRTTWQAMRERKPRNRVVTARLSVRGLFVHADRLEWTARPVAGDDWPWRHLPSTIPTVDQLRADRTKPSGVGPWLDVSLESTMLRRTWDLDGRAGDVVLSDVPEDGMAGSIDIAVPDKLGPVTVYHVAPVFVRADVARAGWARLSSEREWVRARVMVDRERLLATSVR